MSNVSSDERNGHDATSEEDEEEMRGLMDEELKQREKENPCLGSDPKPSWWKTPSIFFMFPPFMLLSFLASGLNVPKLNLVLNTICIQHYANLDAPNSRKFDLFSLMGTENPLCDIPIIQARGANLITFDALLGGILSLVIVPRLGALSDQYGRVKLLAVTTSGFFMDELLTIYMALNPQSLHYNWFLLGSFLENVCGGLPAATAIMYAYSADCFPPDKRKAGFSYLTACASVGMALGPFASGVLLKASNSIMAILYVMVGIHFTTLMFIWFLIPESLHGGNPVTRKPIQTASTLDRPWWKVWVSLSILWPTGPGSTRALRMNLTSLAAISTILGAVAMSAAPILLLFSRKMFNWDVLWQSIYRGILGFCRFMVLVFLLPSLIYLKTKKHADKSVKVFERFDVRLIQGAIAAELLGFLGYSLSWTGSVYILSGVISSLGIITGPALQAGLVNHVTGDRSGEVLGACLMLHAVARLFAPTAMNTLYGVTVGILPQAAFIVIIGLGIIALAITLLLTPNLMTGYVEVTSDESCTEV